MLCCLHRDMPAYSMEPAALSDEGSFTQDALRFCLQLPKVELHAHLNGSVRDETIRHLVRTRGIESVTEADLDNITSKRHRTLPDCFKLFDIIHKCTTDHDAITQITEEVIHDFASEHVIYLELRTTPKARPECGMTKDSYMQAVMRGMDNAQHKLHAGHQIRVRLLLSIDRREGPEAALETVTLAARHMAAGVVGIDLSGNPSVGAWEQWEGALQAARAAGLRITLHGCEVPAAEEGRAMLRFRPDRLGHMCVMDDELEAQLLASKIPVELCLTSNIKTQTFTGFDMHHFRLLYGAGHPVVLCTDDSGVFGTSLSQEYAIAMTTFNLSRDDMKALALQAVDYTFLPAAEQSMLRAEVQAVLTEVSAAG